MTPADLLEMTSEGALTVVGWVGAACGAGVALLLLLLGLRKALAWFWALSTGEGGGADDDLFWAARDWADNDSSLTYDEENLGMAAFTSWYNDARASGYSHEDALASAEAAADRAVMSRRASL